MKKLSRTRKILLLIFGILTAFFITFSVYYLTITTFVKIDQEKLNKSESIIEIYDAFGDKISESGLKANNTEIKDLKGYTVNAFVSIEDKRFYTHNGVDYKRLIKAAFNNLTSFSFKEGGSTITQQLVKNTQLSSDKTLNRKLIEIKLAKELEKKYSKEEILEKYLNTIYFGDNCFGIKDASLHYFGKNPKDLTINESATLAAIINSPSYYAKQENNEKLNERKNLVINAMKDQNYISDTEFNENYGKKISLKNENSNSGYDYNYLIKKELNDIFDKHNVYGKKYKIYTNSIEKYQKNVENTIKTNKTDCEKTIIITDKYSNVYAYYSTVGNAPRQMGSTVKPFGVYAPAIEENVIDSCTKILDEKTDFNGYCPKNYNDIYYGNISAKKALSKSSNVVSAKILNYTGINKTFNYVQKMGIKLNKNDENLAFSLGATENGATATELISAYNTLSNSGIYNKCSCINKIVDDSGNIIYQNLKENTRVFSDDTAYIISDMLSETVTDGTAKKLSSLRIKLASKTGTCGNKNGNTDAYNVSYNDNYTVLSWCGNKNGKLMDNSITGGTLPTSLSCKVWEKLDNSDKWFNMPKSVKEVYIDKNAYEKNGEVLIADKYSLKKDGIKEIFRENHCPKETVDRLKRFNYDNIKILDIYNGFLISLCQTEYCDYIIFKEYDGNSYEILDIKYYNNDKFYDNDVLSGVIYSYYACPYFTDENGNKIYGEKKLIDKIIKSPENYSGDFYLKYIN